MLDAGPRGGVYFLYGPESHQRGRAEQALIDLHLDPATADFNLDRVSGRAVDPETLASMLATPPMMADWRVVVVRQAEALSQSARLRGIVEATVASPPPGLTLVLVADLPSGSKAKIWKRLKAETHAIEFAPLDSADLPGWLADAAAERGVTLEPEVARALVATVGADLGILDREVDKLCAYVGDRARIEAADIEAVVGAIRTQDRWAWFDLVGAGRIAEARAALPVLLDAGESGVGLVLGLGTHFLRIGLLVTGGRSALESALPPHQRWLARRLAGQASAWSEPAIRAAVGDLERADALLKSTGSGDAAILEELLHRLAARRSAAAA